MTNDARDEHQNVCRITKHLDDYTMPHSFTPHPDNQFDPTTDPDGAANLDTYRIQQVGYSNGTFFGLGVQSGGTKPKIFTKALVTDAWAAGSVTGDFGSLASLGTAPPVFILYRSYWYGLDGTVGSRNWWKYGDITSSPTWARALNAIENVTSPIVHPKDDIMYYGCGAGTAVSNQVGSLNGTSWNNTALTFPTYSQVASLSDYGNYLAIAVNQPNDAAYVYLWDRDSSLATTTEKIDWGTGTIKFIDIVDGILIGCSILEASSSLALSYTVVFKYYDGTRAVPFDQFTCSAATIYQFRQRFNNLLYFMAEMTINDVPLHGIWKIMRNSAGKLKASFDRLPRIDDTITAGKLYGFLRTGDYFHIACANAQDSDKYIVTKTANTYTTTASRRTAINPGMPAADRGAQKKLDGIRISFDPLTSGQAVLGYYRVDGGDWVPAFYCNTVGQVMREHVRKITVPVAGVFTDGGNYDSGREFEFRADPSGGARVHQVEYAYTVISTKV